MSKEIFAAGTVPWRVTKSGKIKVLLISRARHNDWSFPKGKVDKGESMPVAAVRETEEEVGLQVKLGVNLGTIHYLVGDNIKKTVQYWATKIRKKQFQSYKFKPNSEVQKVRWVELHKVPKKLTYPADRELFTVFENLVETGVQDTFSLIILRHAKAQKASAPDFLDSERRLTESGIEQAQTIVPILSAFDPQAILSSTAARCLETVKPISKYLDRKVVRAPEISQDVWDTGDVTGLRELISAAVQKQKNALICSHAPVIADLTREIAATGKNRPGVYLDAANALGTADFSVFHIAKRPSDHGIVTVEVYPLKTG